MSIYAHGVGRSLTNSCQEGALREPESQVLSRHILTPFGRSGIPRSLDSQNHFATEGEHELVRLLMSVAVWKVTHRFGQCGK
jgi:hypothetical protein